MPERILRRYYNTPSNKGQYYLIRNKIAPIYDVPALWLSRGITPSTEAMMNRQQAEFLLSQKQLSVAAIGHRGAHAIPCMLLGIRGDTLLVKPRGHKHPEVVPAELVHFQFGRATTQHLSDHERAMLVAEYKKLGDPGESTDSERVSKALREADRLVEEQVEKHLPPAILSMDRNPLREAFSMIEKAKLELGELFDYRQLVIEKFKADLAEADSAMGQKELELKTLQDQLWNLHQQVGGALHQLSCGKAATPAPQVDNKRPVTLLASSPVNPTPAPPKRMESPTGTRISHSTSKPVRFRITERQQRALAAQIEWSVGTTKTRDQLTAEITRLWGTIQVEPGQGIPPRTPSNKAYLVSALIKKGFLGGVVRVTADGSVYKKIK